jgi:hypothetical protein
MLNEYWRDEAMKENVKLKSPAPVGQRLNQLQGKDTKHLADYQMVYEYFFKNPATMFQCEVDTGVPRPYVCWYVRDMRKNEQIQIARLGRCPISKWNGVQFLTTNRELFKTEVKQLTLFDEL